MQSMCMTALKTLSLLEHEPILQLSSFPAGESWGGWTCLHVLAFPWQILSAWFSESGSPLLWQTYWGCLQVPSAFKLVMSRTFQKELYSHLKSQQEQMGDRSLLQAGTALSSCWGTWFLLLNSLLAPDWGLLPIEGGTGLASWSAWCTQNLETKPCWRSSHARFLVLFLVLFFLI